MNEVKITSKIKSENSQAIAVKLNFSALGLKWNNDSFVRVISYPKENKIILKQVANKYAKQVAYKITNTAGGQSSHQKGIYITQKNTRFSKLTEKQTVNAAARIINKNEIEIHLPKEIFA